MDRHAARLAAHLPGPERPVAAPRLRRPAPRRPCPQHITAGQTAAHTAAPVLVEK